jgi:hypothetical protein
MSRRRFMGTAAGAAGVALTSSLWWPSAAAAAERVDHAPRPIPGGIDLGGGTTIHVFVPGPGSEPSTITDFKGLVGVATIGGTGTGTDLTTGKTTNLVFDVDMRFMKGTYVAMDGHRRHDTFGFV